MSFIQPPPALGNQYDEDAALRSLLARVLPPRVLLEVEPSLREMGRVSAELYPLQLADRLNEPVLTQWDAWGNRIDRIELTPLWQMAERIAAEHGVVARRTSARTAGSAASTRWRSPICLHHRQISTPVRWP